MSYRLDCRRYRLPFRLPVRTAHGIWPEREGLIVRLENGKGRVGWGEAAPIPEFGTETVDDAEAACRALGNRVTGYQLTELLSQAPFVCLRGALAAAYAETEEIGDFSTAEPRPKPAPYLSVAAFLPAGRPALAAAVPKAEAGFRVFKWKVGACDYREELPILDDLCAVLPVGAQLRIDANGAWDRRTAEHWLEKCAERPVEFVEQPVAPRARGSADLLLGLAASYPTPLALDESLIGKSDLDWWLDAGWPGIFVIKPSLVGSPTGILDRLAAAPGRVVFSSALETAVGARTALRMAFVQPGPSRALGFGVWPLFKDPRFEGPFAAPFIRRDDVERLNPESVWDALT